MTNTNDGWKELKELTPVEFFAKAMGMRVGHDTILESLRDHIGETLCETGTDEAHCLLNDELVTISGCEYRIGKLAILWTECDGCNRDDFRIVDDADADTLAEFCEEIAADIGDEIVDVKPGHHYTNAGLQYQPTTGYDKDGFETVIVKR